MARYSSFGIVLDTNEGRSEKKIPLIIDRGNHPAKLYKLPGGKSEDEETPEAALHREIEEELSIKIDEDNQTLIYEEAIPNKDGKGQHEFRIYAVNYLYGNLNPGEEVELLIFVSQEEIKKLINENKILPRHAKGLERWINLSKQD